MSDDYVTEWESGKPETPCGKGSKLEYTEEIRAWLPQIIEEYDISSINDIGCGDQNWIAEVDWPYDIEYHAFDFKPRHEDVQFIDIVELTPPYADAQMLIYVLNHLTPKQMRRALFNLMQSSAPYLISSYCTYDKIPFKLLDSIAHKKTQRHEWRYGIWDLQDEI